jgi:hypothetical protein
MNKNISELIISQLYDLVSQDDVLGRGEYDFELLDLDESKLKFIIIANDKKYCIKIEEEI